MTRIILRDGRRMNSAIDRGRVMSGFAGQMMKAVVLAGLMAVPALAQAPAPKIEDKTALPIDKPVTAAPRTMQEAEDKLAASSVLLGMMKPVWTDEQIGRIIYIGYFTAAAALCDGLEVDSAKMTKALEIFVPPDAKELSADKRKFLHDNLTLDIGLATGWVMAGNFRDLKSFCDNAVKQKAEMPAEKSLFDNSVEGVVTPVKPPAP
jgi:hypothetical protein